MTEKQIKVSQVLPFEKELRLQAVGELRQQGQSEVEFLVQAERELQAPQRKEEGSETLQEEEAPI